MSQIDIEKLREVLDYNPNTGHLFWKARHPRHFPSGFGRGTGPETGCQRWNKLYAGKIAMNAINSDGYRGGPILGKRMKAHRVVWAVHYGEWPKSDIDHINGVRSDNRISNLRVATRSQNGVNRKYGNKKNSRFRGVAPAPRCRNKWSARISYKNKQYFLGIFDSEEKAADAYNQAALSLHGEFAFQNKI